MSAILIRAGLYVILAVLALFVAGQQLDLPFQEALTSEFLGQIGIFALGSIALGIVAGVVERARSRKGGKGKCIVCRRPVLVGDSYCREHLRQIIAEETDRQHAPISRR